MQKIPFLIFVGLGILMLGWNMQSAPISLQDTYQEALQAQLKRQLYALNQGFLGVLEDERQYYHSYINTSEPINMVDSFLSAYQNQLSETRQANYSWSADSLGIFWTIAAQNQKNMLFNLYSKKKGYKALDIISDKQIHEAYDNIRLFSDSVPSFIAGMQKSNLLKKLGNFGKMWKMSGEDIFDFQHLIGFKEAFLDNNFSLAQKKTGWQIAENSSFVALCKKAFFIFDRMGRMVNYHDNYWVIPHKWKPILKKDEQYQPNLDIFYEHASALNRVDTFWINGKIHPKNAPLRFVAQAVGFHFFTVKAIFHNPYSQQKYIYEDSLFYEIFPKQLN